MRAPGANSGTNSERSGTARPKVVHVVVAGDIGGAEHFLVELASRPQASGADHCIALMTPNPELRRFFAHAGLSVHDRGPVRENALSYLWRSFGAADLEWLCDVFRTEDADVVHVHTFGSHVLGVRAARRCGLPVVRTEHGVRHYKDPSCALFRHWTLRHTDVIAAVSHFIGNFIAEISPATVPKIRVIHNGVDTEYFRPMPPLAEGPFTISAVSRLERNKRVHLAIEAVALVPGVELVIAGDGSQRGDLERLAAKRGIADRVHFRGYQPDPRDVTAASDVVINCTREEGLGLVLLEAAAMQRPAIAFNGGGAPEIVTDGQTGWLVREDSPAGFATAIREASADRMRAANFGINAYARVKSHFQIAAMCANYAAVYGELSNGVAIRVG